MMTFKEAIESGILWEKTFPSELYHLTGLRAFINIIQSGYFRLSFSGFNDGFDSDAEFNRGEHFYASLSYDKYGRYGHLGNLRTGSKPSYDVILVFDAQALQTKGKLVDVDYWGGLRKRYIDSEKEVRFIGRDNKLSPLSEFIKEAHVFISGLEYPLQAAYYKKLWDLRTSFEFPIYFYDNPSLFKATSKAGSIPTKGVENIFSSIRPNKEKEDLIDFRNYNDARDEERVNAYIALLDGVPQDQLSKDGKHILKGAYYRDSNGTIASDISSFKSSGGDNRLKALRDRFKKYNIKSVNDLRIRILDNYK